MQMHLFFLKNFRFISICNWFFENLYPYVHPSTSDWSKAAYLKKKIWRRIKNIIHLNHKYIHVISRGLVLIQHHLWFALFNFRYFPVPYVIHVLFHLVPKNVDSNFGILISYYQISWKKTKTKVMILLNYEYNLYYNKITSWHIYFVKLSLLMIIFTYTNYKRGC
jgi:hypothetical protein